MFIHLDPRTLADVGTRLEPVGERFYINMNRVAVARFRSSTRGDQGGRGSEGEKIPEGTPCGEFWIDGLPGEADPMRLFFPGDLSGPNTSA